ncbi:MAG TPA: LLM class flavin-dependent oxidoreductase [Roseiflexaceae bacterium]|nr:LLM class flavin-dependent oxidoreductase [Roseiflexaceae bacterium]
MAAMKFGVTMGYLDARTMVDLACEAEEAGWDGFFLGEAIWCTDAWVTLGAAAVRTGRIRLGTLVTPMPLTTPWKLAGESSTLDHLSGGRAILALGMGAVWMGWQGWPDQVTDTKARAEMLDEGIDILTLLYRGKQFDYAGKHYRLRLTAVDEVHYPPPPVQQPRLPIWVVGVWPRKASMRRVLKCDGLIPHVMGADGTFAEVRPEDLRAMRAYVEANRTLTTPFDFVVEGRTIGLDAAAVRAKLVPWAEAGATWWIETLSEATHEQMLERIRQGPPAIE